MPVFVCCGGMEGCFLVSCFLERGVYGFCSSSFGFLLLCLVFHLLMDYDDVYWVLASFV